MPVDFAGLVATFGLPGAMLAIALVFISRAYQKAIEDKEKAYLRSLEEKDEAMLRLEERNTKLEERLFRVLDKAEYVADLAGAPPAPPSAPPVRRRRQEV